MFFLFGQCWQHVVASFLGKVGHELNPNGTWEWRNHLKNEPRQVS